MRPERHRRRVADRADLVTSTDNHICCPSIKLREQAGLEQHTRIKALSPTCRVDGALIAGRLVDEPQQSYTVRRHAAREAAPSEDVTDTTGLAYQCSNHTSQWATEHSIRTLPREIIDPRMPHRATRAVIANRTARTSSTRVLGVDSVA